MAPEPPRTHLARARALARLLDSAVGIPGTRFRLGLDPVLGLIPGLGNVAGAVVSGYVVLAGIQLGAPSPVVVRMLANVAIDTIVGSVPVLGDLFDFAWKSNEKNVALIERHLDQPESTRRASRLVIVAGVAGIVGLAVGGAVLAVVGLRAMLGLLGH